MATFGGATQDGIGVESFPAIELPVLLLNSAELAARGAPRIIANAIRRQSPSPVVISAAKRLPDTSRPIARNGGRPGRFPPRNRNRIKLDSSALSKTRRESLLLHYPTETSETQSTARWSQARHESGI